MAGDRLPGPDDGAGAALRQRRRPGPASNAARAGPIVRGHVVPEKRRQRPGRHSSEAAARANSRRNAAIPTRCPSSRQSLWRGPRGRPARASLPVALLSRPRMAAGSRSQPGAHQRELPRAPDRRASDAPALWQQRAGLHTAAPQFIACSQAPDAARACSPAYLPGGSPTYLPGGSPAYRPGGSPTYLPGGSPACRPGVRPGSFRGGPPSRSRP
jgi:hypothetical protein